MTSELTPRVDVADSVDTAAEAELRACFNAYENALVAGDANSVNDWFIDDPRVTRFGVAEEQWGSVAIREWRESAPSVPFGRELTVTDVVIWSADLGVVTTLFRYPGSAALGRQSQTWLRRADGWGIVHAHVSQRFDASLGR